MKVIVGPGLVAVVMCALSSAGADVTVAGGWKVAFEDKTGMLCLENAARDGGDIVQGKVSVLFEHG